MLLTALRVLGDCEVALCSSNGQVNLATLQPTDMKGYHTDLHVDL